MGRLSVAADLPHTSIGSSHVVHPIVAVCDIELPLEFVTVGHGVDTVENDQGEYAIGQGLRSRGNPRSERLERGFCHVRGVALPHSRQLR